MNVQVWIGVFGLVVCAIYLLFAVREIRRDKPGHALNAAKIHLAMVAVFAPFCLLLIFTYL